MSHNLNSTIWNQIALFTKLLFELLKLRLDNESRHAIQYYGMDDDAYANPELGMHYTYTKGVETKRVFTYCLERRSDFAAPTEHEEPVRLLVVFGFDEEHFISSSFFKNTSKLALLGHGVLTWNELIDLMPSRDLTPWIEAVRAEIENWTAVIDADKPKNDVVCQIDNQLELLSSAARERATHSPDSGLVKLISLFAQTMTEHLNDTRVTLKRDSVRALIKEIQKNLEG